MAESGIDIVAHHRQLRQAACILLEIIVNYVGITVVAGNQAEWRIGIFVDPGVKTAVNPIDNLWQILPNRLKKRGVSGCAPRIPLVQADVLRILMEVKLAFDEHQVVRLDADARSRQ